MLKTTAFSVRTEFSVTTGELNEQFSRCRAVVKEGTRSVDQGTSRNRRCARRLWQGIRKGNRHSETFRVSSGPDRGRSKSALGESSGKREGCSETWQTDTLGSRPKEDRRCTKGSMGESESWKENGKAGQSLNESWLEPS
jgi:hypothetical protein